MRSHRLLLAIWKPARTACLCPARGIQRHHEPPLGPLPTPGTSRWRTSSRTSPSPRTARHTVRLQLLGPLMPASKLADELPACRALGGRPRLPQAPARPWPAPLAQPGRCWGSRPTATRPRLHQRAPRYGPRCPAGAACPPQLLRPPAGRLRRPPREARPARQAQPPSAPAWAPPRPPRWQPPRERGPAPSWARGPTPSWAGARPPPRGPSWRPPQAAPQHAQGPRRGARPCVAP